MKRKMLGATTAMVAVALAMPSSAAAMTADGKCGPTVRDCVNGAIENVDDIVDGVVCRIIPRPCND